MECRSLTAASEQYPRGQSFWVVARHVFLFGCSPRTSVGGGEGSWGEESRSQGAVRSTSSKPEPGDPWWCIGFEVVWR